MAVAGVLDTMLADADVRLAKELGSLGVGQPDHRSVSVVDLAGSVLASSSPDHIGNAEAVARAVLGAFTQLADGDAVVLSDPHSGSAHVQDHWMTFPLCEGASPVALILLQSHMADVGGQGFGNYFPHARDVWQEGVVTTPVRLARDGRMDRDVMETLKLNSRAPLLMGHDISLMYEVGLQMLNEISAEMVVADGAGQAADARERMGELATTVTQEVRLEAAIHNCAGLDARVSVRLAPGPGGLVVDLTESSSQVVQGFINCTLPTTRSAIARACIDYTGAPSNSGVLDALDIQTVRGSVVDCEAPHAVGWSPFDPAFAIGDLLRDALSRSADMVVPQRVREPARPPVRIDGCRAQGCGF
jgi:N-methylhydantoinase B